MAAKPRAKGVAPDRLPKGLVYHEEGNVAFLTLARPDRLNALTFDIYEALRDVFAGLAKNSSVRAVVLTGQGRGFSSGGDVEDIIGKLFAMDARGLHRFTKLTCDVVANMRACPQPIIAALNGVVAGAGAALAIASDVRLAVPEAKISFLFVKVGLSAADMGACLLLPRLVGLGRATEMLLLGDAVPAEVALKIGLYNRVVPAADLLTEARAWARRFAQGPRKGLAVSKATLDRELSMSLSGALALDAKVQAECMQHPDFREAYEAFKAKRPARFA